MGNVDCRNFYLKEKKNEIKYNFSLDTHHNYNININNINSSKVDTKIKNKSNSKIIINNNKNNNSTSSQEIIHTSKEINSFLCPKLESEKSKKFNDNNNFGDNRLEKENNKHNQTQENKENKDNNYIRRKSTLLNFEHRRMPIEIIDEHERGNL